MPAAVLGFVLAAAVLSGAASLLYEVVWLRMLGLVVGHAVDALAAVLAAFMAGLAIGAALFGHLAGRLRRPLAACAWLEGAIAAHAAAALLLAACRRPPLTGMGESGSRAEAHVAERPERSNRLAWLVPCAMAVSGAAAMVFEIAWTRALSLVIGSSTYAFTSVLVV